MVNSQAKTVVFSSTTKSPRIHVIPRMGRSMKGAFSRDLFRDRNQNTAFNYIQCIATGGHTRTEPSCIVLLPGGFSSFLSVSPDTVFQGPLSETYYSPENVKRTQCEQL